MASKVVTDQIVELSTAVNELYEKIDLAAASTPPSRTKTCLTWFAVVLGIAGSLAGISLTIWTMTSS